jgi:drug/metabolite transporter (DMT)-like permease
LWWGALAGLAGCLGLVFYYSALASGTVGVVAPIASMGVILPVLVGFARGDALETLQVVGIAVAIIGVVLTSGPELSGGAAWRPVLFAVGAGCLFGVFFVVMQAGARSNTLMTLWSMRAGVTCVFAVLGLVRRTTGGINRRDFGLIAMLSTGDLLANLFYGIASTLGYLSVASVLSSLYPVVTVLLARLILSERMLRIQVAGVAVTMVGVALVSAG